MNDSIDRQQNTVSFERVLSATPEQVFDAWTQPEQIALWWDPTGAKLSACSIDLRPAGAFRFETQGHAPPFSGIYKVVDRPGTLVFEAMGALGTVYFRAKGSSTLMHVSIRCASPEHLEMFLKLGVDTGTGKTLNNLVEYLRAQLTRTSGGVAAGGGSVSC